MGDFVYTKAKEKFMNGDLDLDTDTIKAGIVDATDYTSNTTHEFLSSVTAAAIEASGVLANVTITNGEFDADDVTLTTVSGDECEAVIIWKDTGNSTTSPLICYIDSATGLPITPNGGDITLDWDDSSNYIFKF